MKPQRLVLAPTRSRRLNESGKIAREINQMRAEWPSEEAIDDSRGYEYAEAPIQPRKRPRRTFDAKSRDLMVRRTMELDADACMCDFW